MRIPCRHILLLRKHAADGKTTQYQSIILESATATENAAYTTAADDTAQDANLAALENIYDWSPSTP